MSKKELLEHYQSRKNEIKKRLEDFQSVMNKNNEELFAELAFCLFTPQSKATTCWNAVQSLVKNRLLFTGDEKQIRPFLNAVRFPENKTRYLLEARKKFSENGKIK